MPTRFALLEAAAGTGAEHLPSISPSSQFFPQWLAGNAVPFPSPWARVSDGWLCRSTKSASKARRDQINAELQALRSLLPISAQEKERLSYLHTMALVCLRLRGAQLFPPGTLSTAVLRPGLALCVWGAAPAPSKTALHHHPTAGLAPPAGPALGTELLSLLPGFLLVLSADSKLVYISENVAQVLGLSMVRPAHWAFAVTVPMPILVPLLHAQHAAPADAGLWLQQAVPPPCQPGLPATGTVSEGIPLFGRWSCLPRGTRSLTSWMGELERTCTRSSSLPGRSLAGVREASAVISRILSLCSGPWP